MSAPASMGDIVEPDDEAVVDSDDFPWSSNPDWVTLSPISDLAYRIFSIIRAHVSKENPRPFPSQRTLASILGYAKTDPISAAIQELRDLGAITTRQEPCAAGRRTRYKVNMFPPSGEAFAGPRKTSDLYAPGVLEGMAEARARRKRGVQRNPSGRSRRSAKGDTP